MNPGRTARSYSFERFASTFSFSPSSSSFSSSSSDRHSAHSDKRNTVSERGRLFEETSYTRTGGYQRDSGDAERAEQAEGWDIREIAETRRE